MEKENMLLMLDIIEKELKCKLEKDIKKEINNTLTKITDDDMIDMRSALTNLALICDWNVNNIKKHLFFLGILKFENNKYLPNNKDTRYDDKNRILIKRNIIKDLYMTNVFVELIENNQIGEMVKSISENKDTHLLEIYNLSNPNAQRKDDKFKEIRKVISLNRIDFNL